MLKIFSTQLSGYFSRLSQKEEMNIEDSARLLAQALIGDGFIYLHGTNEMEGIVSEALFGAEPMKQAKRLIENGELAAVTSADRVLLISRFSTDDEIITTAKNFMKTANLSLESRLFKKVLNHWNNIQMYILIQSC